MNEDVMRRKALDLWEAGQRCHVRRELDEAKRLYRESIAIHPTAEAHTFLGWALSWEGDIDGAIRECERAIEVDPDFGNPYNDIGAYLVEKGELEQAIPWLERATRAVRYEPRHFPHLNLGRVYTRLGRVTQAIAELERALTLHPGDPLAKESLARLRTLH